MSRPGSLDQAEKAWPTTFLYNKPRDQKELEDMVETSLASPKRRRMIGFEGKAAQARGAGYTT